jgi:cytidine deaminase
MPMKGEALRKYHLSLEWRVLLAAAEEARSHAYAPYSHFAVGAAVRSSTGRTFGGCNVENAAYGLTMCAERVAIFDAVCNGERELVAMAVVSATGAMPCGSCRQVLVEFAPDVPILVADTDGNVVLTSVADLLPESFSRAQLAEDGTGS